tara:strand:- start:16957 stop:17709 length:753 start_codon:yes stop_codon:yes gene_type:complete
MDNREIRRNNLKALMAHYFPPGTRGAQSRFGDMLGRPQNVISRLLAEPEKKGAKNVGEDLAREIEAILGLHTYALDDVDLPARLAGSAPKERGNNVIAADFSSKARNGEIAIPHYDVRAAMGAGQVLPSDYIETIRHVTVSLDFLQTQGVSFSKPENLGMITGFGESMNKTFASGDPLIIDRGITSLHTDGVYMFTLSGALFVKRLQMLPNGVRVISDNDAYPPYDITGNDLKGMVIHARVLLAWRSQRL